MPTSSFVYVTYVRTTPDAMWSALTDADRMKQYWFGMHCECPWTAGSSWKRFSGDGSLVDVGEIVSVDAPRRLIIRWRHEKRPELRAEGDSLCTMELEPCGTAVRLSVTHSIQREPSALIAAVSDGWPKVISNLKSWLETGAIVLPSP